MGFKIDRIASSFVKEISYILANEIRNQDIRFVTVTDCKVTNDLSFAKVYVTVLDNEKKETTLKALNDASSYIRKNLASRVDVRHIPELVFVYDESIEYGEKIENIIEDIHHHED